MRRLGKYIRPYVGFMIFTMLIKLTGAVVELMIPRLMETILDDIVPTGEIRRIFFFGGLMLLCAFLCLACNVIANRMTATSSGAITKKLRSDLFAKLQHFSAKQMDTLTVCSAESRLTSDTYNINQMFARGQRLGVRAPILVLGGVIMMLSMDTVLALVLIALLPLVGIVVYLVTKASVPLYTNEQSVLDRVVTVLQENITGVRVIKALSKTDYEKGRFAAVNDELTAVDQKAGLISAITNPSTSLILNLGLTLVVVVGAYRVNAGRCQSGVIIAFLQYFVMILNAMLGITRIFVVYSKGEASARRVADVLAAEEDLTVQPQPEEAEQQPQSAPHIEFRDVSFSYTGIGANIDHLSFSLNHGESLGILGETGSGKSTVLNLLMRLYDVQEGAILIDGQDVRTMAPESLRSRFGVAFQNDFIVGGNIEDNIRFFRSVTDDDVQRAARDAQAAEFIESREDQLKAEVTIRGTNLSGGQKQRLLIARALAAKPEILLLDDASSALDYRTDAELRKALHRSYSDTTTILVAQRISSIRGCTHILVLSDGKTIGYGTHEQLLETCEEYRMIAASQMGDGKELA